MMPGQQIVKGNDTHNLKADQAMLQAPYLDKVSPPASSLPASFDFAGTALRLVTSKWLDIDAV